MTKLVQLSDEAYRRLKNLKRGRESFSDVVNRVTRKGDLSGLWGLRSGAEIDAHEKAIREVSDRDRPETH
ncbi:MAG: antitoxin VapB family protein [Euryarchaeota archaeon]|nr:antitoxin VapB family protein [Euryarchaeota archaeon]